MKLRLMGRRVRTSVTGPDEIPLVFHDGLVSARARFELESSAGMRVDVEVLVDEQAGDVRWTITEPETNHQLSGGRLSLPT